MCTFTFPYLFHFTSVFEHSVVNSSTIQDARDSILNRTKLKKQTRKRIGRKKCGRKGRRKEGNKREWEREGEG
jgi:hypothetical protein